MPNRLDNLKLMELSLVDNPANQHSKVTLYKRHDPEDCSEDEKKLQRKQLDRVTALQERIDLLKKDVDELVKPKRRRDLSARMDSLTARFAAANF
jgi:hypothetical protein